MKRLFVTSALLAFTTISFAQTADEVLKKMADAIAGFKDYRVDITGTQWVRGPQEKRKAETKSSVMVKGDKFLNDTRGTDALGRPFNRLQVFDGRTHWDYDRVNKVIRKVDTSKMDKKLQKKIKEGRDPTNLGLMEKLSYSLKKEKERGETYYVLTSTEPLVMENQKFEKLKLWIDRDTYLPYRMEMETQMDIMIPMGDAMNFSTGAMQEFKEWEVDKGIPDYKFSLSIPKEVNVVDETARTGQLMNMFLDREEQKKAAENAEAEGEKKDTEDTKEKKRSKEEEEKISLQELEEAIEELQKASMEDEREDESKEKRVPEKDGEE